MEEPHDTSDLCKCEAAKNSKRCPIQIMYMEHTLHKLMCQVGALATAKGYCSTNVHRFPWINTETHAHTLSTIPQKELLFKKKQNYKL